MKLRRTIGCYILSVYFVLLAKSLHSGKRGWVLQYSQSPKNTFVGLEHHGEILGALALKVEHSIERPDNRVLFYLYTKDNPTSAQMITIDSLESLRSSHFQGEITTVFITHGYLNTINSEAVTSVRDAYLNGTEEINVIAVDWSSYSISFYNWAVDKVESVGMEIARMIDFLRSNAKLKLYLTTLVGHSLGAHIMGVAGRNTRGMVNQIFALDPAGPSFEDTNLKNRLSPSSARNVQVIHTNGNKLGFLGPLGHADFYPNGGSRQPGCALGDSIFNGACSHGRSFWYFAESLNSPIGFKAIRCRRGESPYTGHCRGVVRLMGGRSNEINTTGLFYLKTHDSPPYAVVLRQKQSIK